MSNKPLSETQPRVIRVFVSSTFRDMQAERDELTKFIFPQLRKLCEQRGVAWGEVDLRWGITDEQKSEGKVLPICLDEIQRCRPYFIGLLGERYGWIPDEIPSELVEREPWLAKHIEHSVTELEILHGVLNNPKMAEHAFFYFRNPKFLDTLTPEQRSEFMEVASSDEIEKYSLEEANRRAEKRKQKLAELKERIQKSSFPVHENYQDPKEFGQLVLQDLTAIIDDLYPEGSQPDPLDREAAEHEVFARSRAQVYIGRQTYFDQMDAHARGDGAPLVVLGESGSGKSALLANWAIRYRSEHPKELVLMHFIGATPGSADWVAMLRRILGEFKRKFDIREEIPDQPDALRSAFANWLNMAAAQGRVILVLDALNQLDDRDGAPDLVWLPPHMPENVRMFLSTLPGRPLDELKKRGWPSLTIELLQPKERKQLIKEYLALFTKTLDKDNTERIAGASQCQNPLFLRVLLNELRLFGEHERLGQRIEYYLQAPTIPELYELILQRCEQDYDRDRPGLVRDSMSLIWAARRGLSEAELMDLLGSDGQPLPMAYWSPLSLALEQSLLSRGGLVGFSHEYFKQAVASQFLPTESIQKSANIKIADYFNNRDLGPRKVDELAWQLLQAKSWERLFATLTDLPFLFKAWHVNEYDVRAFWVQLESGSPFRLVSGYQQVINAPQEFNPQVITTILFLLKDSGHNKEAMVLGDYLIDHYRQSNDLIQLAAALGNQALLFKATGDLDGAMALHKQQERLCLDMHDDFVLQHALGGQADILYTRHDLVGALAFYKQQGQICLENGYKYHLAFSLSNQGGISLFRGDLKAAMELFQEVERICKEIGNKDGLALAFGNQAAILSDWGNLDSAENLRNEQESIYHDLGNLSGLQNALGGKANIFQARGALTRALDLFKEQEQICLQIEDWDALQHSVGSQAAILRDQRNFDGASVLYRRQETICLKNGLKHRLASVYLHQAEISNALSDLEGAQRLMNRARQVAQDINDQYEVSICLGLLAVFLYERKELDEALGLYQEQEKICKALRDQHGRQYCLGQQAAIHYVRGDFRTAINLLSERVRICRENEHLDGLQAALGSLGVILKESGNQVEAMRLFIEQEQISRRISNFDSLQRALGDQANILFSQGKKEESLKLHNEEEELCRKTHNLDGLQGALGNKAGVIFSMGKVNEAITLLKEKEDICQNIKQINGLVSALTNQAVIQVQYFRNLEKAHILLERAYRAAKDAGITGKAQQMKQMLAKIGY